MVVTAKPFAMMMIVRSDFDELILVADDPELNAQVPAKVPPGEGQRHPSAPLLHIQDLRLQGDSHLDWIENYRGVISGVHFHRGDRLSE